MIIIVIIIIFTGYHAREDRKRARGCVYKTPRPGVYHTFTQPVVRCSSVVQNSSVRHSVKMQVSARCCNSVFFFFAPDLSRSRSVFSPVDRTIFFGTAAAPTELSPSDDRSSINYFRS